jgi:hypothetical protein
MDGPSMISVYIDSCAWDYFFHERAYLAEIFPPNDYQLFMTREVEIELSAIPDVGKDGTDNSIHATTRFFAELETLAFRGRGKIFTSASEMLGASNSKRGICLIQR